MSARRHPGTEALARYQAGLAGSFRGRRLAAHVADCTRCASVIDQLAAVGSVLAAAPAPSLPATAERQITAALAAAATDTAARPVAGGAVGGSAVSGSAAGGPRRPRTNRFRLAMAAIPTAACLVFAGLGYLLSQSGSSSSSSPSAAGEAAPASLPSATSAPGRSGPAIAGGGGLKPLEGDQPVPFVVIESGTVYRKATLGAQVRSELDRNGSPGTHSGAAGSRPAASATTAGLAPSQTLVGCVLHLTGNAKPRLVEQATYQGERAYVIAVTDRAWVVGLGCTASHPALITSVALPG